ncbi:histidine phosphatase family protein [Mesorhizobium sp.]|uniref:histidine phosphatase family protein n=1 Tax=Mesorhizobium sp. TaxID=1871066 RepID=UPI0025D06749|nr:histidine phosphatase family protein [Mesorhizobium sp.]
MAILGLLPAVIGPLPAAASEQVAWAALRDGAVVLFRHARAPGSGDPPGFRIDDCATQRNLDSEGRAQARRMGDRLRAEQVRVGLVLASEWCRALETAELAFPGQVRREPAFNSFFEDRTTETWLTQRAKELLAAWRGPGALVVVTHQVNIGALTGLRPSDGEGIVVRVRGDEVEVVGRIQP